MAQRLLTLGHELSVWNRTNLKTKPLVDAGAKQLKTPAELVAACDTIIVMLLNDAALDAVYNGPNGLLQAELGAKLVIEMSTVLPETMTAIGNAVVKAGGGFVECPVGGTVGPHAMENCSDLLAAPKKTSHGPNLFSKQLCRRIEHVGGRGAGRCHEACDQSAVAGLSSGPLGEALTLCKPLNLPADRLIDILSDTAVRRTR